MGSGDTRGDPLRCILDVCWAWHVLGEVVLVR
jgi:hypothetical protein